MHISLTQAIAIKMHMRTKHPTVTLSSSEAVAGATMVYSCQSCRYQTVNRQSWLDHVKDHRNNPPPVTSVDATANEQLYVIQGPDSRQLVLAPFLQVATSNSNSVPSIGNAAGDSASVVTGMVEVSQPQSADQHGLRHILTAISEQQQCPAISSAVLIK